MAIVFYVKCRPQDADAWPIARDNNVVFIGYPPSKQPADEPDALSGYRAMLFDIAREPACASLLSGEGRHYRTQVSFNANLVAAVTKSSDTFVMVPRPEFGECYVGRVTGSFQVVDAPPWAHAYLELRRRQRLPASPATSYVSDVVQCWTVDQWRTLPFPRIPRWISYRLLSRNTAGLINGFPDLQLDAYSRVRELLGEVNAGPVTSTEARLAEWVSPSTFEHLVVHLLQLEAGPQEEWHHVGGSGDGGVDGLAVSPTGEVTGALQCKWHYQGDAALLAQDVAKVRDRWPQARVVIAILLSTGRGQASLDERDVLWRITDVARLLEKHRKRVPLAVTLGIEAG